MRGDESLLGRRDDLCEPRVQRAAASRRLDVGDGSAQQRMSETHTQAVELENPRVEGLVESSLEASTDGRFHNRDGRIRERSDGASDR